MKLHEHFYELLKAQGLFFREPLRCLQPPKVKRFWIGPDERVNVRGRETRSVSQSVSQSVGGDSHDS